MVNVVYTLENTNDREIIFLAGPTYRTHLFPPNGVPTSWRKEAEAIFRTKNFEGSICLPEHRDGVSAPGWTYEKQVDWELEYCRKAKVIMFWIPRNMKDLPGLTTNIEFGEWLNSGKIVAGAPKEAEHMAYIRNRCDRIYVPWADTLEQCVDNALMLIKDL